MNRNDAARLGIFVKEPIAGFVKTRLTPPLSPEQAARLYGVALAETLHRFADRSPRPILFFVGSAEFFRTHYPDFKQFPQDGDDLGQKMANALSLLHADSCGAAALIGSDSPDLPIELVDKAFAALAKNQVVTVPATDGGYVLVGTSGPCPEVFSAVPWSTPEVLARTRQLAREHGLCYTEIDRWHDLDDIASLLALVERSPESATAVHIRRELSHLLRSTA